MTKSEIKHLYEINCDKRHEMRRAIVENMRDKAVKKLVANGYTQEMIDDIFESKIPESKLGIKAKDINKILWADKKFKRLIDEERNLNNIHCERKSIVRKNKHHTRLAGKTCIIKGCGCPVKLVFRCKYHYSRYSFFRRTGRHPGVKGKRIK